MVSGRIKPIPAPMSACAPMSDHRSTVCGYSAHASAMAKNPVINTARLPKRLVKWSPLKRDSSVFGTKYITDKYPNSPVESCSTSLAQFCTNPSTVAHTTRCITMDNTVPSIKSRSMAIYATLRNVSGPPSGGTSRTWESAMIPKIADANAMRNALAAPMRWAICEPRSIATT